RIMSGVVQIAAAPSTVVAVPRKYVGPIPGRHFARLNLVPKHRRCPVVGPTFVKGGTFGGAEQTGRRVVQDGVRVLVSDDASVLRVVDPARSEDDGVLKREVLGVVRRV